MSKDTNINHPPKPDPIKLGTAKKTYATASANRPPTNRMEFWSWKMVIHADDVENSSISLGRLPIRDVRKKLEEVYKALQPQVFATEVEKQSFVDLIEIWYLDVVVPRLPTGKIRDEFKLSQRTVVNYQQGIENLGKVAKDLLVSELNEKSAQEFVRGLQLKYAPRTVQLHATTLRQILLWARKKQKIDTQRTVVTKRPKGEKGYVNNRHTPTDADVDKLLTSMRMCSLKKMVYIGWKTGARTGEICNLVWGDVCKNASEYWIRFCGKTGNRKCSITEEVYTEIRGFKKDAYKEQDRLFTPSFRTNCSPQLRKSCEIRWIEPFTVYGLRRLRVDTLQRQGVETAVYERIMGHSIRMAQEIYRTTNDADLQGTLVDKAGESSKDVMKAEVLDIDISLFLPTDNEVERLIFTLQRKDWRAETILEQTYFDKYIIATARFLTPKSSNIHVDILFASSGIEKEIIEQAEVIEIFQGIEIPIARIGHLLALKILPESPERPRDTQDIKNLISFTTEEDILLAKESCALISKRGFHRQRDLSQLFDLHLQG